MKNLETGVDRLVSLTRKEKRIPLEKAAQELGVSLELVREWTNWLEENGLVDTEEKFSKITIIHRDVNRKQVEHDAFEYNIKRNAFVSEVDSAVAALEKETVEFEKVRSEFRRIHESIGLELTKVEKDVHTLHNYEKLKLGVDADIRNQEQTYKNLVEQSSQQLQGFQRQYQKLNEQITRERQLISEENRSLKEMDEKQQHLMAQLSKIVQSAGDIKQAISLKKETIAVSKKNIAKMEKDLLTITKHINKETTTSMRSFQQMMDQQQEKITFIQKEFAREVASMQNSIDKHQIINNAISEQFINFMEKRKTVEHMILRITEEQGSLREHLVGLKKQAQSLDLYEKNVPVKVRFQEIRDSFNEQGKRRRILVREIEKVSTYLNKFF